MQKTDTPLGLRTLFWYGVGFLAVMLIGIAIGRLWPSNNAEAGTTRIEAYTRCTALIDKGAQWEESKESWRCKVVPEVTR